MAMAHGKRVRLDDVARLAGVSRSTASRVINGHPNVRPETRHKVLEAIRKLGYHPNTLAQGLSRRRTRIIGLLVAMPAKRLASDQFYPLFLQGAAQAANRRGYRLMLGLFEEPAEQEAMYVDVVRGGYLDGLVVVSVPRGDPLIPMLLEEEVPFVLVGRDPDWDTPYVEGDNYRGGYMATEHLLRLGYRRIGTITGPLKLWAATERLRGYQDAHRDAGLEPDPGFIVEADFTEIGGMAAMRKLLEAGPEAVFVQSDTMAAGALRAVKAAGLKVPDDIALVGYDDAPLAELLEPPLTTVHQPIHMMGYTAVEMLIEHIERPKPRTQGVILPVKLVVRRSCGALPQP